MDASSMNVALVTGAGGSIGSVLCERLIGRGYKVIALDQSEYNLYRLHEKVPVRSAILPLLVDVRHDAVVRSVIGEHAPQVVFHAAALKHVPLLQVQHNALEAVRTNILGTDTVLRAAHDYGVPKVVLVSTDKAVQPVSMMGATKTWAERLVVSYGQIARRTQFSAVRFGNVVGSSGSVVPLWEAQIAAGGPVTLTDRRMLRYMMSIEEAVDLLISASKQPAGMYVLDMGELISMYDLAVQLIAGREIAIEEIGIRPGEKLVERLYDPNHEWVAPTEEAKVLRISTDMQAPIFGDTLALRGLAEFRCFEECVDLIQKTIGWRGAHLLCESL